MQLPFVASKVRRKFWYDRKRRCCIRSRNRIVESFLRAKLISRIASIRSTRGERSGRTSCETVVKETRLLMVLTTEGPREISRKIYGKQERPTYLYRIFLSRISLKVSLEKKLSGSLSIKRLLNAISCFVYAKAKSDSKRDFGSNIPIIYDPE